MNNNLVIHRNVHSDCDIYSFHVLLPPPPWNETLCKPADLKFMDANKQMRSSLFGE